MSAKKLILEAFDNGVHLALKDGKLVAKTNGTPVPAELKSRIKAEKDAILAYLKSQEKHAVVVNQKFDHIPVVPEQESYPIPTSLFRIWVLSQFEQGNVAYNMPGAIELKGEFNKATFDASFIKLIERHEILRTTFRETEEGAVRQFITPATDFKFEIAFTDVRQEYDPEGIIKSEIYQKVVQPFDLANGPLLMAHIYQLDLKRHVFFFNMHHMINDGWSMEVFINEIFHIYNALHFGTEIRLPELHIQYKDFAVWQQKQLEGPEAEAHKAYWLKQFAGEIPVLDLPSDFARPAVQTYNGSIVRSTISKSDTQALNDFVKQQDGTQFIGLVSLVYTILHLYSGQDDIIIGSPTAGRTHIDLESQLGFYVNTLALRAKIEEEATFNGLFAHVKEVILGAFDHQIYPFGDLVDELDLPRNISRSPLFDVMLVLHNQEAQTGDDEQLGDLEADHYTTDYVTSKFDLSFYFKEQHGEIKVTIEYNTDIFSAAQMEQMSEHFGKLLSLVLEQPEKPLQRLDYLGEEEKIRQLKEFNQPVDTSKAACSIVDLYEKQVAKQPDKTALRRGEEVISYKAFDQLSNRVANFLTHVHQVAPQELVGVMLPHSPAYVSTIFGILKAGAAYVPIETNFPFQRIKGMIGDAGISLLITADDYNETADHLQWECEGLVNYLSIDNDNHFNQSPLDIEKESRDLWDYVAEEADGDAIKGGGWINSYSGDPFSVKEMDEFSDNVVLKLKDRIDQDSVILEIGSGSGLILSKLAPFVKTYIATDISPVLVSRIRQQAEKRGATNIIAKCLTATEVDQLNEFDIDVIIVNSVVQYFSGHGYLRKMLSGCLNLLKQDGLLFLGDIMDLDSRDVLIAEHIEYKGLHPEAETKLDFSTELFLSATYFENLLYTADVAEVQVSEKIRTIENELTRFRYDVLLTKGKMREQSARQVKRRYYQTDLQSQPVHFEAKPVLADHLAYVTFTSGSTGKPKGVMICHRNVTAFVDNYLSVFGILGEMSIGAVTNISFDIAVLELIGSLCMGMEVVFLSGNDPVKMVEELNTTPIDVLQLTPSRLQQLMFCNENLLTDLRDLKVMLVGGEALPVEQFEALKKHLTNTHVFNVYGPTETTVWSTALDMHNAEKLTVGTHLVNEQIYILNGVGELQPRGVTGEIYIGGTGVGRGYLNRPELTAGKFINSSYNSHGKIYATGDLGRWTSDGQIEFVNRKDDQVKIRGYRIELGEIESCLLQYPGIEAAVLLVTENDYAEKNLAAFLVVRHPLQEDDLRKSLSNQLPEYMIPSDFVQLRELPLLASGKVDRKALKEHLDAAAHTAKDFIKPEGKVQEMLLTQWAEVLGKNPNSISADDSFFKLGGHSLKATRLMSVINKAFEVRLLLNDLFSKVTISEQAALIESASRSVFEHIPKAPEQSSYTLSSQQMRLWVLSQFEAAKVAYNMPGVFELNGEFSPEYFKSALEQLIDRHEILRTVFTEENEEIRQVILDAEALGMEMVYSDLHQENKSVGQLEAELRQLMLEPFDLESGPLLAVQLHRVEENRHILFFNMHHIITDGWSIGVFVKEMLEIYQSLSDNRTPDLPALRIQHKDYAEWQKKQLEGENLKAHEGYWLNQFSGELPMTLLPEDKVRPASMTYAGAEVSGMLSESTSGAIHQLISEQGCTMFMGLVAGVKALLYRYTGLSDVILGTAIAGRQHEDLHDQIGFYVNTLALRTRFEGSEPFTSLLDKVKETTLNAYEHQVYPFDKLIDHLNLNRDESRSPLFNIMVILQNNESAMQQMASDGLEVREYDMEGVTSKFDLTFIFTEMEGQIHFILEYNRDIYSEEQMQLLAVHFKSLMTFAASAAETRVDKIGFLDAGEQEHLLNDLNLTAYSYENELSWVDLFEKAVENHPERTALVVGDKTWTYQELNAKANQLAAFIETKRTIQPDDLIAIRLHRTEWMLISMLAVLKAGAAYVPVFQDFPQERIDYIISDSQCELVLDQALLNNFIINQDSYSAENPTTKPDANHLAYVIYTSGSTGQPKGVMIEHQSLVSFIENFKVHFGLTEGMTMLATTNFTFDISVLELLGTLVTGGTCHLASAVDAYSILDIVDTGRVDALQVTPSRLKQFFEANENALDKLARLKTLLVGGEALNATLYERLSQLDLNVINVYGPTETTIWSTFKPVEPTSELSIGKPLLNESVYVLDANLNPVPVRVKGDIYIGGEGLARGYWNNPELTEQRFIPSPFDPGQRLYHTGDVGRWLPNGELSFEGRSDDQVKIRGYRIELSEVESALQAVDQVEICAVAVMEGSVGSELVAYLVSHHAFNIKELRDELSRTLPDYMIPSYFAQLDEMPLTASGKVDYQNLPSKDSFAMDTGRDFIAPKTDLEHQLAELWADLLGIDKHSIGLEDNFFELGGNSINAIQLTGKINKRFELDLPWISIFQNNTVRHMATVVEEARNDKGQAEYPGMVALRPDGEAAPLYLVAGTGGFVMGFFALVQQLDGGYPVYGLEPAGIHGETAPHRHMEDIARYYIQSIRQVQPHGPYRLLGHSFGTFVIFEMCKQLKASGEKVSELILLDTGIPPEEDLASRSISTEELKLGLLHTLQRYFEWDQSISDQEFLSYSDPEQHQFVQQQLQAEGVTMSLKQAAGYMDVFAAQGAMSYLPSGFIDDTQIILFKTTEMDPFIQKGMASSLGWEKVTSRYPVVHDVAGNHLTLLHPKNVTTITEPLNAYFAEKAEAQIVNT